MTGRRIRLRRALGVSGILLLAVAGPMVGAALAAPQVVVVAEEDGGGGEAPAPSDPDPAPPVEPAPTEPGPTEPKPAPETQAPSEPKPEPEASEEPEGEPSAKPTKKPTGEAADDEPVDDADQDPDAVDEDPDAVDEDPEALDEDGLDGDVVDDGLDEDALDEDALDEDALDEDVAEDTPEEDAPEDDAPGGAGLGLTIVAQSDGVSVSASGDGLQPGSRVELWVFSTPRLLATSTADADGAVSITATLPADLPEGAHTVLLKGIDVGGQPVEFADGIEIGPNGELLAVTEGVDASGLVVPTIPDDPKAPQYPTVTALDQPDAVVSTTVAALALLSVTGVAAAMGGGARMARNAAGGVAGGGVAGGGINEGLGSGADLLVAEAVNVEHNRGWRTRFSAREGAWGDNSFLHRAPLTSVVDEASYAWMAAVGPRSPLLARMIGDGAPLRAMFGSVSMLLPIAAMVLGVWSAILGNGIAEPPVLGILIALMVIGVLDGLAGALGAVAFGVTVIAMGGILDWSSVRTLLGVALLIAGPGLIASSFRDIRRAAPRSMSGWWERGADVIIVPLLGAYTTYNVANAMPPLGGSLFPVAEASTQLAWIVAAMLVLKVVLEEVAARWFPERMATILAEPEWPGTVQQVLSSLTRLGLFLFISAAFIGSPWQLWVGAVIWILPTLLYPFSERWRNIPRLWQVLPANLPSLGFGLLVYLSLAAILGSIYGDTTEFALMAFFVLLIPGFIEYSLGLLGREPESDDVRWYLRPSMTAVYRVGGIVVLAVTCWLAYRSIL